MLSAQTMEDRAAVSLEHMRGEIEDRRRSAGRAARGAVAFGAIRVVGLCRNAQLEGL